MIETRLTFIDDMPAHGSVPDSGIVQAGQTVKSDYRWLVGLFMASPRKCAEVVFDHTTQTCKGMAVSLKGATYPDHICGLHILTRGDRVYLRKRPTPPPPARPWRREDDSD